MFGRVYFMHLHIIELTPQYCNVLKNLINPQTEGPKRTLATSVLTPEKRLDRHMVDRWMDRHLTISLHFLLWMQPV